jgi:hypothetical protein
MRLRIEAGFGDYEETNSRDPVGETEGGVLFVQERSAPSEKEGVNFTRT